MINLIKGFHDYFSPLAERRNFVCQKFNYFAQKLDFGRLETPIVEEEAAFIKTLGSTSEVILHQFFYLQNISAKQKKWVLRPELTSGIMRAIAQKKIFKVPQTQTFYSSGPCFRYEKPQKGRTRQFWQWNVEQIHTNRYSLSSLFQWMNMMLSYFKLEKNVLLKINYLNQAQIIYLKKYLHNNSHLTEKFCASCLIRQQKGNIHRILDCSRCASLFSKNLNLLDCLDEHEKKHFAFLQTQLKLCLPQVKIVVVPTLTRGLNYYQGLVFELKYLSSSKWAKNVILAGGEYSLSTFISASSSATISGVGFAIGIERFLFALEENQFVYSLNQKTDILIGWENENHYIKALQIQKELFSFNFPPKLLFRPLSFSKCMTFALKNSSQWLIYLSNRWMNQQKVELQKINFKEKKNKSWILSLTKVSHDLKTKIHSQNDQ